MAKPRTYVLVPIDTNTVTAGAREVKNAISAEIGKRGLSDEITVVETAAFGPTDAGVLVAVQPDNVVYANITVANVAEIVEEHFVKGRQCKKFILAGEKPVLPKAGETDSRKLQELGRIVLDNCGVIDPENIKEYIARDGYFALGKTVTELKPEEVIKVMKDSGLRGRGGAGFPTGLKWSFCAPVKSKEKYVICNADEGEPGTFKDRLIMEGDPHKVIEGMTICGYAIGGNKGFIYIRGEYKLSIQRLQKAISDAREYGFLGKKIFGSTFSFDIEIKIGAGAYVCGEETALIESMEGKRGLPRLKPPFPAQCGFRGKPTNVNNVETLANVPPIIRNGADWFKKFGTAGTPGTKVYTVLGHINRPGLIEVPTGVTLREVIYGYGGGMKSGKFHFAQLGGTAGDILGEEMLDVPLDYDAMQKNGHVLGSGAILIVNDSVDIKDFLYSCMKFFVHESCGNCNPCRNGLKIIKDITQRLKEKKGYEDDIDGMEEISMILKSSAFCPLGQSPAEPIMSALRYFKEEIKQGIDSKAVKPTIRHTQRDLITLAPV
ncbi:MAG TPA: NADH-quinone oxidoreductase subunit NuoF [Lentisphaeria bacterium]|nr:MAG: NADP oxidoreductase [Lentisphaerae bacterium GWF2_49_21]HBC85566.1 NADH-quinone oxidoreductase subunit NuoF [Lentisphaeria bacterium]